ncbi:MAG: 3,2-trans-enoyl-CoA isomerase, partial [Limisphaerales bacterium]
PAGGCLMAIAADYRVMAEGKYTIGLNEVAVGIIVPEMVHKLYSFWIGNGKSYSMLLEGALVGPTEAKAIGLINEVAAEDEVIIRAEKQLKKYMGFHPVTWKKSKANLRTNLLKSMEYDFDSIFAPALKLWWEPTSRAMMKMIVDGMKAKKTEKKVS